MHGGRHQKLIKGWDLADDGLLTSPASSNMGLRVVFRDFDGLVFLLSATMYLQTRGQEAEEPGRALGRHSTLLGGSLLYRYY
jgi:hypothetical protein